MNIELKRIEYCAWFPASSWGKPVYIHALVFIDGKEQGYATRHSGDATHIYPHLLAERLDAYGKTLPKKNGIDQNGETIINDLLATWLLMRDFKRASAKRILYTKPGLKGIFRTNLMTTKQLARCLADSTTATKFNAEKILNNLPVDEAIALYGENA